MSSKPQILTAASARRAQLQERAAAMTKKLTTSSAVNEERARMSKAKPNCAAPRGWVASVRKTNNDLAGRSLPKPPSPTRQQLPRTKTTSWGRFESSAREAQPQQQISKPLAKRGDSSAAPRFTPVEDISGTCAAFSQSMPPMRCPASRNSRLRECTCEIRRWIDYYCGDSG
ncbi:hypothetical protein GPALN_009785 [Globodera pallida]|nr:hypothetical protein GPALN_009785 [Globodera pallida]